MSKIKFDDKPIKKDLSAADAMGVVGGAAVPTKASTSVADPNKTTVTAPTTTTTNLTLTRVDTAAALARVAGGR